MSFWNWKKEQPVFVDITSTPLVPYPPYPYKAEQRLAAAQIQNYGNQYHQAGMIPTNQTGLMYVKEKCVQDAVKGEVVLLGIYTIHEQNTQKYDIYMVAKEHEQE